MVSLSLHIYRQGEREREIEILEVGSCVYGDWEVPQSTVCKLENLESQWCNLVWVQKPENWEANGVSPGLSLKAETKNVMSKECPASMSCIGEYDLLYSVYWFKC